jgi:signal transduction histidine kinase
LIKNAYIHNGRDVKLSIRGNGKILYVIDYGLGINRKALKSIFDKFYSRHRGGVGIGLFFCKSAMEQMGGSIKCESEEGKYTKFILDFSKI